MDHLYTCPMHPEVRQDHPGNCPICGMDLEPLQPQLESEQAEYAKYLMRFKMGAFLTFPVALFAAKENYPWIQWLLCTPVVFWAGAPFFEKGFDSLRNKSLNMFSLISLGVGAAYLYSVAALFFPGTHLYFEAAAVITVLVLLGQVLEMKSKTQTGEAIRALLKHAPQTALREVQGREESISIDQVAVSDLLRVKPGEKIPVDGIVVDGTSFVDTSMITGESMPIEIKPQDKVTGGTINQNGSFLMKAERVGSETMLARIIQMVSEAQRSRAPIQKLADQVSGYFVPAVILVAILTFVIWISFGPAFALMNSVAVLIIACPCALGLATPMSIMVGIGEGAKMGVLIKNAEALETLETVDTLVTDKTGTLTEGKPKITQISPENGWTEDTLLRMAAAVEKNSEHPLAQALLEASASRHLEIPKVEQFRSITGFGVAGVVEGQTVEIGKGDLFSSMTVQVGGKRAGTIMVSDPIKPSALKAVNALKGLGIELIMLTGDNPAIAKMVADALGIAAFKAGVNPEEKNRFIEHLKQDGRKVAMAGDGINDAPALARADVGIAMGGGTDVAMESAGITLLKGDLSGIVKAIALSRATMGNIRQNLFLAFIYNFLCIPIAAGLFYPWTGVLLNPMIAALAMTLSSLSVILNALRLKRIAAKIAAL